MNKKVLVLLVSPRKNGNTDRLADEFVRGALDAGNRAEKIFLRDMNIKDCIGCGACQRNGGSCIHKDDMQQIYGKLVEADVIAFASPVYFYSWTSLMKRAVDRTFAVEKKLTHKRFCLISAGAAPEEKYMQTMLDSYHQYISCFRGEDNEDGGYVIGCGTNMPGDVVKSPAMQEAYRLGFEV